MLAAASAFAEDLREIELMDGGSITGEVLSLSGGIYTIKSDSLGTIRIEASRIRAIRAISNQPGPASPVTGGAGAEVGALKEKMMSDKEILDLILSLQDDPEIKKILEDPAIMKAVQAGDVAALMADPRFMNLLNNKTLQDIQKKAK
jgi:hypothetical protein